MRFILPFVPPALLGLAAWPAVPVPVRVVCGVAFGVLLYAWRFGLGRPNPRI
jgi:hypothetical protein